MMSRNWDDFVLYYRRFVNNQLIKQNYNNNKCETLIFISFMKCLIIYMH